MDRNLQTFINFLDSSINDMEKEIIRRVSKRMVKELLPEDEKDLLRITERKNMRRLLSVPREEWELHGEIYIQFDYLADMLEESPLNARGMFAILVRLLEKNLSTNITHQDARCFDIQQIDNYKFKYMTRDEFLEFVRTDEYGSLKQKEESELTEDEKKKLEEFNAYSDLYPLDIAPVIEVHKSIKEHYFDKLDSFTNEDIEIFLDNLRQFKLSENLINIFRTLLLREVEKRQKREVTVSNTQDVTINVIEEVSISKKEYNLIERELRKYFDLSTMKVVGPLTLDLQIYCVGLLLKLGISEDKIRDILRIMNEDGYNYDNPISMFVALQEKLEYYNDVEGVSEAIKTMIGVMTEITFGTDVDYEEWKEFLSEELASTLKLIPKTYDYEIEKAKKGGKK
jgi:hypothetical protein